VIARAGFAAAVLVLIVCGDALAQSGMFGGGRLPSIAPTREYKPPLGITFQERGSQVALRFDTSLRCGRSSYQVSGRRTFARSGNTVAGSSASVLMLGRGRIEFSWEIGATFEGDAVTGSLRITGRLRYRGRWRRCSQKPVRDFTARAQAAPAGAPVPAPRGGAVFHGLTDMVVIDGLLGPVTVRVGKNGKRLGARWTANAACRRGPPEILTNRTRRTRIRPSGRFERRERFTQVFSDARVRYRVRFAGRFRADGVSGTVRVRAVVYDARGRKVQTRCDTGKRRWTATRAV
jgi:hypothetical protein